MKVQLLSNKVNRIEHTRFDLIISFKNFNSIHTQKHTNRFNHFGKYILTNSHTNLGERQIPQDHQKLLEERKQHHPNRCETGYEDILG